MIKWPRGSAAFGTRGQHAVDFPLGKELIIKRIQATQTTICPGFERFCKNKQYTNDDPITPECQCEQWKRNGPPCLMSAAFHYYKLDNHTIIQKDINK